MNIYTVRDNLKNTIAGKEQALALYESRKDIPREAGSQMAMIATIEFLKINIDELRRILQDVEVCCKQASDDSWITNPDRQGGGGWTAEELDPNRGWK
jgi:hypothetical protein